MLDNTVEKMRSEIESQEVFKFEVIEGWAPAEEHDLLAFDQDDMDIEGPNWEKLEATVDSGAAHSVADVNMWPSIPRVELPGSRAGSIYLGPGKERIPNRG